ncbi:hypothetical protein AAKU67_003113 [Oxalobacteraceae bacterium GrIS 2.11]
MKHTSTLQPLTQKHANLLLGLVIALILSPYLVVSLLANDAGLIGFFPDDAFYYLKTARNLIALGSASFDGINPTNGFHPLYFLIATLLAALTPFAWYLKIIFLFHVATIWLAIFMLLYPVKRVPLFWRVFIAAVLACPIPFLFVWLSAGMESALVILCTVLLCNAGLAASQSDFRNRPANLWLGTTMALYMLARLDLVLTLIPFGVWILYRQTKQSHGLSAAIKNLITIFLIPLGSGICYLAFNIISTGHIMPVSAAVKHVFVLPFMASWLASTGNGNPVLSALALLPLLIAAMVLIDYFRGTGRAVFALVACSIIIYAFYLVFGASNFFRWYFAMPEAAGAWLAARWIMEKNWQVKAGSTIKIVASVILVSVALVSNLFFVRAISNNTKSVSWQLLQIAGELERVSQPCDIAAVFDAGVIGYFSNRTVINLDGLANSYSYLDEYRKPKKFTEYLDKQGVNIFILRDQLADNSQEIDAGSYEFAQFSEDKRLRLDRHDELFRHVIPGTFTVIAYRYNSGNKAPRQCATHP